MAMAGTVLCGRACSSPAHNGPRGEVYKCPVACTFATIVVRVYKATVYGVGQYGRTLRRNLNAARVYGTVALSRTAVHYSRRAQRSHSRSAAGPPDFCLSWCRRGQSELSYQTRRSRTGRSDHLAGTGKETGVSAHEESTWCCGEHQTSWEAAGAPQDRLWPASRVRTTARTPCRATGAVDRAICCSQVAGALESRVCVGIGACPSQRIGSKVRGIARLSHGVLHCSHGAASELHPARHQPRAPAPHIL